jgi:hypothetical protein
MLLIGYSGVMPAVASSLRQPAQRGLTCTGVVHRISYTTCPGRASVAITA